MNQALEWLKSNIPIIIFAVVIVAAPITFWIISGGMNESVQEEIQSRARGFSELRQIESASITNPRTGDRTTGVVNPKLLDMLKEYSQQSLEDSRAVLDAAIEHNRKDYTVLMPELFPAPPPDRAEVYPRHFPGRLASAYADLLDEVRAGMPPSESQIAQELNRREQQFRVQVLLRGPDEPLNREEREQLEEELRSLRMLRYEEHAAGVLYYLNPEMLNIPDSDSVDTYHLDDLFDMQWVYWIHSDVLRALASANEADGSVIRAPVKRVVNLRVGERQVPSGTAQSISPATEVSTDFAVSLSGRRSNHLYDVRMVDLRLIVDANRVYDVIDAISTYNFMTVLDFQYSTANPYQAARAGYFYGPDPVVELTMKVETVWFRKWTSQYMPEATLRALRIQADRSGAGT